MMRSLWTAASGMIAQQTNVDTISNNLANVNTTGYKTQTAEFKSLLYQNLQTKTTTANGENKPIPAEVGLGVRNSSITTHFSQGSFMESTSDTAFAINGDGFFAVQGTDGETYYTRNGNFTYAIGTQGMMLTTTDGLPVLDSTGQPIVFDTTQYDMSKVQATSDGKFGYLDENNNYVDLGIQIGLFQFNNPSGLDKTGGSLYSETAASGQAINESVTDTVKKSTIKSGYLEGSNVQVADEMVNLIVAQRAYEMNSKAIQASDEMLSQANQLRR
ncbi:MAG: flagellar hook-basal body protein [Lachnospiraceae bacterium]|nr:flagellar hook-basal body protein [Lachnospiraceae bacterium]